MHEYGETAVARKTRARLMLQGVKDLSVQTAFLKGAVTMAAGQSAFLGRYDAKLIEPYLGNFSPLQQRYAVNAVTACFEQLNEWKTGVAVKDIHRLLDEATHTLNVQKEGTTSALDFASGSNTGVAAGLFVFVTGQMEP